MGDLTVFVYTGLKVYSTRTEFFIVSDKSKNCLRIEKENVNLETVAKESAPYETADGVPTDIVALLGIIDLVAGPYLAVATESVLLGYVDGDKPIHQITKTDLIPFSKSLSHLTPIQISDNNKFLDMIKSMMSIPELYYSESYDITHTMQRLQGTGPQFLNAPLITRADLRFVWNHNLLHPFEANPDACKFIMPIMCGFVHISQCTINGTTFKYIIISRRSNKRTGARLYVRGGDTSGNVANYVETEQILETPSHLCSYVITRGSIPLLWNQYPNMAMKPKATLSTEDNGAHMVTLSTHMTDELEHYHRRVTVVNLINRTGSEGALEKNFNRYLQANEAALKKHGDVFYEFFDFHHECKNMQWQHLSKLIAKLDQERQSCGYFQANRGGRYDGVMEQQGVFRVNCIDCLDRTNVVKSLLCRETLQDQLRALRILGTGEKIIDFENFMDNFKDAWIGNADSISIQYAGTGALKTDFTRTGKRSRQGAFNDFLNSSRRWFRNNFLDGFRQDAHYLFHGVYKTQNYKITPYVSPFESNKPGLRTIVPPVFAIIGFAMTVVSSLMPSDDFPVVYVLFWTVFTVANLAYIFNNGSDFVDKPKLLKPKTD